MISHIVWRTKIGGKGPKGMLDCKSRRHIESFVD